MYLQEKKLEILIFIDSKTSILMNWLIIFIDYKAQHFQKC